MMIRWKEQGSMSHNRYSVYFVLLIANGLRLTFSYLGFVVFSTVGNQRFTKAVGRQPILKIMRMNAGSVTEDPRNDVVNPPEFMSIRHTLSSTVIGIISGLAEIRGWVSAVGGSGRFCAYPPAHRRHSQSLPKRAQHIWGLSDSIAVCIPLNGNYLNLCQCVGQGYVKTEVRR